MSFAKKFKFEILHSINLILKGLKISRGGLSPEKFNKELALEWTRVLWQEKLWKSLQWYGVEIHQWPTDLLILQEIVFEQKPRFIIETGTYKGGSAIFFASLFHLYNPEGQVISVELNLDQGVKQSIEKHPLGKKIILLEGSSTSDRIMERIDQIVGSEKAFVFFDSDHSYGHVLAELRLYHKYIPVGGFICAFDTICRDLHDLPSGEKQWKEDNPHRAVMEFLKENDCFEIDPTRNRLLVGFAPDGFLRRIK